MELEGKKQKRVHERNRSPLTVTFNVHGMYCQDKGHDQGPFPPSHAMELSRTIINSEPADFIVSLVALLHHILFSRMKHAILEARQSHHTDRTGTMVARETFFSAVKLVAAFHRE